MRRLLIAITVTFLGIAPAFAKPKVAVTPVEGDGGDKMNEAVRDLLDGKLAVVAPRDVERAMSKLGLSGELEESDAQKLSDKLDAAVVVQGKLGKSGKKKTVKLTVWVRGKKPSDFNVQYKSVESEKFRDAVREALLKRIGSIDDLDEKPKKRVADGDDDDKPKKRIADGDDDDKPKKRIADGDDDDKPKKKKPDGDDDKPKKKKKVASVDDDDDGKAKARKRKRSSEGDGEGVRERAVPQPAVRLDAGLSYAARYLTYKVNPGAMGTPPPKVFTPAPSGRFEGEIYPLALASPGSALAGLGIFGEYDKTFGLSIDVPKTMGKSTPINQAHYSVGLRYRIAFGKHAISAGAAYARRHYIADRSTLEAPTQLDAPDVDYAAVTPVIGARTQLGLKLALFAEVDAMLVMSAGAISKGDSYGPGTVFGMGGHGGVEIALGKKVGLRLAAEYNQINHTFKGKGTQSNGRNVTGATDRDFGMAATLGAKF